ncbi:hypothetical protein V8E52_010657 [Russula decolorans]
MSTLLLLLLKTMVRCSATSANAQDFLVLRHHLRWSERCRCHEATNHTPYPFSDIRSNTSCFLEAWISKLLQEPLFAVKTAPYKCSRLRRIEEINPVVLSQNLPLRESANIRDTRMIPACFMEIVLPSSQVGDVTWRELAMMPA